MRTVSVIKINLIAQKGSAISEIATPVLFILSGNSPGPCIELARYSHNLLLTDLANGRRVQDLNSAISRLIQFLDCVAESAEHTPKTLGDALVCYFVARLMGTQNFANEEIVELNWPPVSKERARVEYQLIIGFFDYCHKNFGTTVPQFAAYYSKTRHPAHAMHFNKQKDFFEHLNLHRKKWSRLIQNDVFNIPTFLKVTRAIPCSREEKAINREELTEIVRNEMNPVFRALFIILGYGCLRASEPLHFWQIDILPPNSWYQLFGTKNRFPLVLRCHPALSHYVSEPISNERTTRQQLLGSKYKLIPRNMINPMDPRYAGWKGTVFQHPLKFMPTYFLADCPIVEEEMRVLLSDAFAEIQYFHKKNRTSQTHPYFFSNMTSRHHSTLGEPTQMSNMQDAWNRSVRRVGLRPHIRNRNLHALRHHYFANAKKLGLSASRIQNLVGHSSLEAQRQYGNEVSSVVEFLSEAQAGGKKC